MMSYPMKLAACYSQRCGRRKTYEQKWNKALGANRRRELGTLRVSRKGREHCRQRRIFPPRKASGVLEENPEFWVKRKRIFIFPILVKLIDSKGDSSSGRIRIDEYALREEARIR